MADDADTDDWKFSVDEVGPEGETEPGVDENGHEEGAVDLSRGDVPEELVDDDESEGNVAGSLTSIGPIEPETPAIENAVFVVLGVYVGVLAIITMIAPGVLASPLNVLAVTGGVVAVALLSLGFFGVLTPET